METMDHFLQRKNASNSDSVYSKITLQYSSQCTAKVLIYEEIYFKDP